ASPWSRRRTTRMCSPSNRAISRLGAGRRAHPRAAMFTAVLQQEVLENVKRLVGWLVFLLAFLVAMSMGLAAVATAQEASTGAESAEDYHRITGFRSARFGMTPDEVRAA